jgi:hypothetical protein
MMTALSYRLTEKYFFAVPCMYATMLWANRETLRNQDAIDSQRLNESVGHITFLVEAYKPNYYFFEVDSLKLILFKK